MDWIGTPWGMGAIGFIALFLFGLSWLGVRIKLTREGLITSRDTTPKAEPIMPERYIRVLIDVVEMSGEHRDKLRDLRDRTIEDQMRAFEETELATQAMFKRGFSRIAEELAPEIARREARAFLHMVRTVLADIKSQARKWCRANHFYSMTSAEWEAYVVEKRKTLEHLTSEAFDTEWISDVIPRDDLRAIGRDQKSDFDDIVDSYFKKARQISIRTFEEMQEERAKWSAYMMRVGGYDPYNRSAC